MRCFHSLFPFDAKIDYDIIGQSFYPQYHGTLAMLQQTMIESEKRFTSMWLTRCS